MNYYLSLPINLRITLKSMCHLITGMTFPDMVCILGFKQTVHCIEQKLKIEGIIDYESITD